MATPRTTRSRAKSGTPLPAVGNRSSYAYGAKGKAHLGSQVENTGDDFAAAFANTRHDDEADDANKTEGDDNDEDDESISVAPTPGRKRGRPKGKGKAKATAATDLSAVEEEDQDDEMPERSVADRTTTAVDATGAADRTMTAMDNVAGYETAADRARPLRPPLSSGPVRPPVSGTVRTSTGPFRRSAQVFRDPAAAAPVAAEAEPKNIRVPGYINYILAFLIVWFLLFIYAYMPLPTAMEPFRDNFCQSMRQTFTRYPYDLPSSQLEENWSRLVQGDFSNGPPVHPQVLSLQERIEHFEQRLAAIEGETKLQAEAMHILRETLPSSAVLKFVDGQYEIPNELWHALRERLATDDDMTPLWKAYIERNRAQIDSLMERGLFSTVDQAGVERQLVSQDQLAQALRDNNDWLAKQYHDDFKQMTTKYRNDMKDIAEKAANNIMVQSPASTLGKAQLERLIIANDLHNHYQALHSVNYFSFGLGARVVPRMTSATTKPNQKTWMQRLYMKTNPRAVNPHPPNKVLERWQEATDCWCANVDTNGSTKVTILTARKIYPDRLTIEHIPAHGTLNINAAPRLLELWAWTDSTGAAEKIEAAMSQANLNLDTCGPKPAPEAICVARGKYDIHMDNHVQSFASFVDTEELAFAANKFTVKVAANWGGVFTCIYRLRLTGQQVV